MGYNNNRWANRKRRGRPDPDDSGEDRTCAATNETLSSGVRRMHARQPVNTPKCCPTLCDPTLRKSTFWLLLLHASRTRFAPTVQINKYCDALLCVSLILFPQKCVVVLGVVFQRQMFGEEIRTDSSGKDKCGKKDKCAGQLLPSNILSGAGILMHSVVEANSGKK